MDGGDSTTLRLNADRATWRRVDDELVVLDLESSAYLSVNVTGATLWPLLQDGATRAALVGALCEEFDVDDEVAARDVDDFLHDLERRGLLIRD